MKNHKLSSDLIWNYLSIGITALCGAAFSIIIGFYYPESILGRFNTIYSYYIVMSQFCVCGIHMAIVKYSAESIDDAVGILVKSLLITVLISSFMSALFFVITNVILEYYISDSMLTSFNTIWFALVLFSLNKVFLGWLNGKLHMRAYAFFQAIRYVTIALVLVFFSIIRFDGIKLTYCFLYAEVVVAILSIIYICICRNKLYVVKSNISTKDIFSFGIRILPSNAILELNTKIDVICLSLLLNNEGMVGVYSFAAMFVEGFYQLLMVLRKIINPYITMENSRNRLNDYIESFKTSYLSSIYKMVFLVYLFLICGYYVLVKLIGKDVFFKGIAVILIVCICIVINTKMIVFGNALSQIGYPGTESMINIVIVVVNVCLNIFFILICGVLGAAVATGLSYFAFSLLQKRCFMRKTGILL